MVIFKLFLVCKLLLVFIIIDVLFWGLDIFLVDLVIEYDLVFSFVDYIYCVGWIVCVGCFGDVLFFFFLGIEEGYIELFKGFGLFFY